MMEKIIFSRNWFNLILILVLSVIMSYGCNTKKKKIRKLENFDTELWINDKNGCSGDRLNLKDQLLGSKYFMRGLKAEQIEDYLGKPDAQELYNRSQRYYIYFLDPGPKCEKAQGNPQALFVRFSAVGIANEFIIKTVDAI